MPGVIESAVIGVPHADFGEGVTAVVVCGKGAERRRGFGAEGARRPTGEIQDAEARVRGRRVAAQRHGQGAEEYFARYLADIYAEGEMKHDRWLSGLLFGSIAGKRSQTGSSLRR